MTYVTLQEASEIVQRETGIDITVPQLIRAGAVNGLPLCVLLNQKCYSPSQQIRREQKEGSDDPDHWVKTPLNIGGAAETVDVRGLFVLPFGHVFDYQTKDTVRIDSVTSLDGNDTYCPGVDIRRDEVQIMLPHLDKFIAHIKSQPRVVDNRANPDIIESTESELAHKARANHDITKERGCRRQILDHWEDIELLHPSAYDARQVMRVISRKKLESERLYGLHTYQNNLNDLRKEKLIP